ncbi:hypothetical protein FB567DRAFT_318876 [Paraphoma chrysanthemicola]|uniref:Potassium channel tetramerisation-type BTB domain-containing protein n=1 Tax=Paraphoma chrysanthemicola TaxID=798071 RepID=A0A8K0RAX3_9PLEO|nr:hypothetical protein FB567DRAFT_318876 [Paraphoma chrysanthemicola]
MDDKFGLAEAIRNTGVTNLNSRAANNEAQPTGISNDAVQSDSTLAPSSLAPNQPYPNPITLDIGSRTFKTSLSTLQESGLFRQQLSERYTWAPQVDGSYFLDADPDLFAHLLRFMRRPEVFPLFYTKDRGFDYDLYNRLEAEAEYFQLDTLREWIMEKKYEKAVVVHTSIAMAKEVDEVVPKKHSVNVEEDWHVIPRTRKVYVCPRGIFVHRGDPDRCGQACRKARGDGEIEYDKETYEEVVIVRKEFELVAGLCKVE